MARTLGWIISIAGLGLAIYGALKGKPKATAAAPTDASRADSLQASIDSAKRAADTIRGQVANDPLAASLLNVPAALLAGAVAPENNQKVKDLQAQIIGIQNQIASAQQSYGIDHFGGQSQAQFSAYIAGLNAQIADLTNQIGSL